jgi:hypothetical protein
MLKTLRGWLKRDQPTRVIPTIQLDTLATLNDFRQKKNLVDRMQKLWKDPFFKLVVSVLSNTSPRGYPPRGTGFTAEQALVELGRKEGYADAIDTLRIMAIQAQVVNTELETTWGVDDEQQVEIDQVKEGEWGKEA